MSKENPWYIFNCRVVRLRITDDTYECVITNLDRNEFPIEHFRKRKLIRQEIYARVILYNFCQRIVQEIKIPEKSRRKYKYQINFTRSFHILREFLKKKGGNNPPVENLIAKEILPVHPGRRNTRNIKAKKAVCFNYRYDCSINATLFQFEQNEKPEANIIQIVSSGKI